MELLQVVPSCVATLDDAGETDGKEYVTVKIRKKCKNFCSFCHSQVGFIWKFMNSCWFSFNCEYKM